MLAQHSQVESSAAAVEVDSLQAYPGQADTCEQQTSVGPRLGDLLPLVNTSMPAP